MHSIFFMPQAREDLKAIKDFIGKANIGMSIRVMESILFFVNNLSYLVYAVFKYKNIVL